MVLWLLSDYYSLNYPDICKIEPIQSPEHEKQSDWECRAFISLVLFIFSFHHQPLDHLSVTVNGS